MNTELTTELEFAPRTIARARTLRAQWLGRFVRIAMRKGARRFRIIGERLAMAWQYQRELAMLLNADERMLKDIGLTRADIRSASEGIWWANPDRVVEAASKRRAEAMDAARSRHALPRTESPALVPAMPRQMAEIANFR